MFAVFVCRKICRGSTRSRSVYSRTSAVPTSCRQLSISSCLILKSQSVKSRLHYRARTWHIVPLLVLKETSAFTEWNMWDPRFRVGVKVFMVSAQHGSWISANSSPAFLVSAIYDQLTVVTWTSLVSDWLHTVDVRLLMPAHQTGTHFLPTSETIVFLSQLSYATLRPFSFLSAKMRLYCINPLFLNGICLAILPVLTHCRITHELSKQPSTMPQPSDITEPVDVDGLGLGFVLSNWNSTDAASASI